MLGGERVQCHGEGPRWGSQCLRLVLGTKPNCLSLKDSDEEVLVADPSLSLQEDDTSPLISLSTQEDDTKEMFAKLEGRAAAVLRNMAHDGKQHSLLIQSGAVDVLADIMRRNKVRMSMGRHHEEGQGVDEQGSNISPLNSCLRL